MFALKENFNLRFRYDYCFCRKHVDVVHPDHNVSCVLFNSRASPSATKRLNRLKTHRNDEILKCTPEGHMIYEKHSNALRDGHTGCSRVSGIVRG